MDTLVFVIDIAGVECHAPSTPATMREQIQTYLAETWSE
jgi:hypothetical protein